MADTLTLALAETLANQPGMAERLIGAHVDDGAGLCARCSTDTTRTSWPCTIAWHVGQAAQIRRITVTVPRMSAVLSGSG